MAKVTDAAAALAQPIAEANGCVLWDVEYVKEAGSWYLRVYIDREGGVDIDACEAVSRALSDALDEADPIPNAYILEVSSAGIDRALKKPEHFAAFLGSQVDVKLYRSTGGGKEHTGALAAFEEDGAVTIETPQGRLRFPKADVAQVRLHVTF